MCTKLWHTKPKEILFSGEWKMVLSIGSDVTSPEERAELDAHLATTELALVQQQQVRCTQIPTTSN
jgi:hypothetical protein